MISIAFQAWRTCLLATSALGLLVPVAPAWADADDALAPAAVAGEIAHKQKMRQLFPDLLKGTQATPPVIPQLELDADPTGVIATYQPNGTTRTATSPFFQNLGTNGRTCFTCHEPQDAWGLSAQHVQARRWRNLPIGQRVVSRGDAQSVYPGFEQGLDSYRAAYAVLDAIPDLERR
jgi:hypothetical protein